MLLIFDGLFLCFIKAIWDFQIFQGLRLVCETLDKHRPLLPKNTRTVDKPKQAMKPKAAGIQASSVVTMLTPLSNTVVLQITVHYSTTETHEIIWAYNILGHMIPVEGNTFYVLLNYKEFNKRVLFITIFIILSCK